MIKRILPAVIAVVVVIAGLAFFMTRPDDGKQAGSTLSSADSSSQLTPPKACDLFTLEDAKKVLGDSASTQESAPPSSSTDDIEVTLCSYSQPSGGESIASLQQQKQASLLVRGAKSTIGVQSNEVVFNGSQRPEAAQTISGYGEMAYWNPEFGQLNIFKNGNWYILSLGVADPSKKSLDETRLLADLLISKL